MKAKKVGVASGAAPAPATGKENDSQREEKAAVVQVMTSSDGSGKSLLGQYKDIFGSAEGKDHSGDHFVDVDDTEQALAALRTLVQKAAKKAGGLDSKKGKEWKLRSSPLKEFDKSIDDLFLAFLRWAIVDDTEDGENGKSKSYCRMDSNASKYNVSKAFRRLESYANWMYDVETDLVEPPLTASSVEEACELWNMKISYDRSNRLLWWFDMSEIDFERVKHMTPTETVRFFVWYSHAVMFDDAAQTNGMSFVANFGKIGFWPLMTMMPIQLWPKLDGLTIGVLPLRMKEIFTLEDPVWYDVIMAMMSPFMSKKMKGRMVSLGEDYGALVEKVGAECIPLEFGKFEGKFSKDMIAEKYFGGSLGRKVIDSSDSKVECALMGTDAQSMAKGDISRKKAPLIGTDGSVESPYARPSHGSEHKSLADRRKEMGW